MLSAALALPTVALAEEPGLDGGVPLVLDDASATVGVDAAASAEASLGNGSFQDARSVDGDSAPDSTISELLTMTIGDDEGAGEQEQGADATGGNVPAESLGVAPCDALGASEDEAGLLNMYRLYNPNSGEHFYTASLDEAVAVADAGWQWEGVGWVSPDSGEPVHRLYNENAGDHHYTMSEEERDSLVSMGWLYEGVGWYSGGSKAVLRQYNANAQSGSHNFTASVEEDGALVDMGWSSEGLAWQSSDLPYVSREGFWLICSSWGDLSRYWVGNDGSIAVSRLVTPDEGAPYYAYASDDHGAVVRGKQTLDDVMLLADPETGGLAWTTGWLVTDAYDTEIQRYYLWRSDLNGLIGARLGAFTVDDSRYYGREDEGYVVRGTYVVDTYYGVAADGSEECYHDDTVIMAGNDGILLTRAEVGQLLVRAAQSMLGAAYDEEGSAYHVASTSADSSFNCSGFTWWVYNALGINLSHNQGYYSFYTGEHNLQDSQMWGVEKRGGWKTLVEELQPGDLVFFSPSPYYDKYHTGHVGVYIGNGLMIDSSPGEPGGVAVRSARKTSFVGGGLPITLV